jgi:predicted Zn-dependent peptidase
MAFAAQIPPAFADDPPRVLDVYERRDETLSNGVHLVIVRGEPGGGAAIVASFEAGEAFTGPSEKGLATLTAAMLRAGSVTCNGLDLESRLDRLGARLESRATADVVELAMDVSGDSLPGALDLIGEILAAPAIPESIFAVERERLSRDSGYARTLTELACDRLARILFDRHPYSESPTPASVGSLERRHLLEYHSRRLGAASAVIVIAGDFPDDEALVQQSRTAFANLPPGFAAVAPRPSAPPQTRRRVFLIDRPGSKNAAVATGNIGIRYSDPDLMPALVVERILGAPTRGRISAGMAEAKIEVGNPILEFRWGRDPGLFLASAVFDPAVIDSGTQVILTELDRIRHEPILPEEAESAIADHSAAHREYVADALGLARETATIVQNGLQTGWTRRFDDALLHVSTLDVSRAARRMIRPYATPIVFAGDGSVIAKKIARFGKVTWLDENGAPVPPERRPSLEEGEAAPAGSVEPPPIAQPAGGDAMMDAGAASQAEPSENAAPSAPDTGEGAESAPESEPSDTTTYEAIESEAQSDTAEAASEAPAESTMVRMEILHNEGAPAENPPSAPHEEPPPPDQP